MFQLCPADHCATCAAGSRMDKPSKFSGPTFDPCKNCQHLECYNSAWGREHFFKHGPPEQTVISSEAFF